MKDYNIMWGIAIGIIILAGILWIMTGETWPEIIGIGGFILALFAMTKELIARIGLEAKK